MGNVANVGGAGNDAARLLDTLAPSEQVTFQTFDDEHKSNALTRVLHGTLAQHADALTALNEQGAGVFWMPAAGDGRGRRATNVRRVRAVYVDLDGAPLEPVRHAPLAPHAVIESSPGRWHAYWRVDNCALAQFTPLQRALAAQFNSDPKVCDLPRVMRLPGFLHQKHQPPHQSRILELRDGMQAYSIEQVVHEFGIDPATEASNIASIQCRTLAATIPEGQRSNTLLSLAAGLVRQGLPLTRMVGRLQQVNAERCQPPLDTTEVDEIAARAKAYGSSGFVMLTHRLLDAPQYRALASESKEILTAAMRLYDGANNGNLALAWNDFEGRVHVSKKTFLKYRKALVSAGFLTKAVIGKRRQNGHDPDLYSIDPRWLSLGVKTTPSEGCKKYTPTHTDSMEVGRGGSRANERAGEPDQAPQVAGGAS